MASLADPAPGNVRDTVDVEAAFSDTTVNPFGRVDTEAELAFAGVGVPAGTPGYSSTAVSSPDVDNCLRDVCAAL
jgi:hypothetical protein